MKKAIGILFMAMLMSALLIGSAMAGIQTGPAPNAGDGVSDGSGIEVPAQNGEPVVESPGPAPNAGDGIPDGSGF